jgi:hypothetical protein
MYWFATSFFILGALSGAFLRLVSFVAVMVVVVVAVLMTNDWARGGSLLSPLIALATLQFGYAFGIVLRALVRSFRSRRARPEVGRGSSRHPTTGETKG